MPASNPARWIPLLLPRPPAPAAIAPAPATARDWRRTCAAQTDIPPLPPRQPPLPLTFSCARRLLRFDKPSCFSFGGAESTRKDQIICRVTWLSTLLGRRPTPNYSLKARMLRTKQANGLDFSTALPASPCRLHHCATHRVFHEISRAAGPLQQATKNDGLPYHTLPALGYQPSMLISESQH